MISGVPVVDIREINESILKISFYESGIRYDWMIRVFIAQYSSSFRYLQLQVAIKIP